MALGLLARPSLSHAFGGTVPGSTRAVARIQLGPPLSAALLADWRSEDFAFTPLDAPGTTIDALQAIDAADHAFIRGSTSYILGVRYGRMTNPQQITPYSAGYEWVVMYQHDGDMPSTCPFHCPPSMLGHPRRYAQTNAVVDARTGLALFKFQTK